MKIIFEGTPEELIHYRLLQDGKKIDESGTEKITPNFPEAMQILRDGIDNFFCTKRGTKND